MKRLLNYITVCTSLLVFFAQASWAADSYTASYKLQEGETHPAGDLVTVYSDQSSEAVATLTFGFAGEADYNAAVEASGILFGNNTHDALMKLDEDTLLAVFEGVPQFEVERSLFAEGVKAVDLFAEHSKVFASKGEMRKLVQGGGVSMNKEKLAAFDQLVTEKDLLNGNYLLVQRGKKNYFLLLAK